LPEGIGEEGENARLGWMKMTQTRAKLVLKENKLNDH
jgi:hypothetical protein